VTGLEGYGVPWMESPFVVVSVDLEDSLRQRLAAERNDLLGGDRLRWPRVKLSPRCPRSNRENVVYFQLLVNLSAFENSWRELFGAVSPALRNW
jgi:hypothetical protein